MATRYRCYQFSWGFMTYDTETETAPESGFLVEDITFPIAGQLPRNGLISISNGLRNTIRNIGSYDTPYNFRLYEQENATWSRSGTTVTVTTSAPHGLAVGDRVVPHVSSNTTAITAAGAFTATWNNRGSETYS